MTYCLRGLVKQSGRTPWRAASLRAVRSNVPRDNAALYEAEEDVTTEE